MLKIRFCAISLVIASRMFVRTFHFARSLLFTLRTTLRSIGGACTCGRNVLKPPIEAIIDLQKEYRIFTERIDPAASHGPFTAHRMREFRERVREMFTFGYDNYMLHAFPSDELDPIHCTGRGPDYEDPSNININDALGEYCLTLVDALDTLAIMGNKTEFHRAVSLVTEYVSFEKDITVQVFEATIRVIGSLLTAHILLRDKKSLLGDFTMPGYDNELLTLAHDLAARLLPAFQSTPTGLPYPRVNLMHGVPWWQEGIFPLNETCTAGAGSLLLEFGVLSRLLGDPTYEGLARRTNNALWSLRDPETGLLGNVIDIQTGEWSGLLSGTGAGLDSFYEYLLKAYILFGHTEDFNMFNDSYSKIRNITRRGNHNSHRRRSRAQCNDGVGEPPLYVNVNMRDGRTATTWIDSLQASFAGVQILAGDLDEAVCQHALYYSIWRKYGALPERYNWRLKAPDVAFYPLRPEFAESTYLLYQSTRNPFYLHVGAEIVRSLNMHTRVKCGFATIHDVHDKSLEDRMESFFLSETCKYLYLLFDSGNPLNVHAERFVFTTEGHVLPVDCRFRTSGCDTAKAVVDRPFSVPTEMEPCQQHGVRRDGSLMATVEPPDVNVSVAGACDNTWEKYRQHLLPLKSQYLMQLYHMVGITV